MATPTPTPTPTPTTPTTHQHRKTMTIANWDGLGNDEDDDNFFETFSRISAADSHDLGSSGSDEDFEDSRMSFASAVSSASSIGGIRGYNAVKASSIMLENYDMWMEEPGSIEDRRRRLLQGMGLSSNKDLLNVTSTKFKHTSSKKVANEQPPPKSKVDSAPSEELKSKSKPEPDPEPEPSSSTTIVLVRSRSDGDIESSSVNTKRRKEEFIGDISKQRLTRTSSSLVTPHASMCANSIEVLPNRTKNRSVSNADVMSSVLSDSQFSAFFLIKNLDTGKEFIVKEYNKDGMWNRLSDLQTGKQLTMEEFEKSVGYSPVVKELMRRENVTRNLDDGRKMSTNSFSKSFRNSKRRGAAFLKNIKGVANSMSGSKADKEREHSTPADQQRSNKNLSSQWVKVRQQGKPHKEFTALHLCQEIQAHEGSIWTIRFSLDSRYLASAGEDRVIHVWEVQECEVSTRSSDDLNSTSSSSLSTLACNSPDRPPLAEISPMPSEKRKKGKGTKKKGNSIPDYVYLPETVFSFSEKPVCTFTGHLDDVLDLSWSKSQLLLSSSMDKTVRLWDMETKSCLKLFAHNDYVTCIQFNPIDDDYFISGSLDAKVRIWNIPDRHVVDWTDLHEMVTAASYTPDGQGALIGSHNGNCRLYSTADFKLEQKEQIHIQFKKKSQAKKITGFQFVPGNPSEVLITSADSRIRIFDGSDLVYKFRGFRNTTSQISATFSPDGKYVVSASEDSQVCIWKREEHRNVGAGKSRGFVSTQSHEFFQCRDVSVAIAWPGSIKNEPPTIEVHSKRHSKRSIPQVTSNIGSPTQEDNLGGSNSKRNLPPLPKKNNGLEKASSCRDEDLAQASRANSGIGVGESFDSASASLRYGDSPSISASGNPRSHSWSSSWSLFDGGINHGGRTIQATAWGLVIVTAGLGGEIRAYQNFGLPLKFGRQMISLDSSRK
ncbi:uncharacterized protein LOC132293524 [Cornus florida]|uniref:uncharacterized protein LOC132293524 n=1 Tax=Cornus florida TaxID=4283 RepID=UPI00289AA630|nr:uncharacterized protein LOC132293524 [Cornus florida]